MRNSLAECECARAKRGPSLWTLPVTRKCMDNNKKHWKIVKQRAQRSNKIYYNGITIRISSKWQIENERDAKAWKYTQREWEYRKRQQAKNYLKPNFLVEHCCLLCCLFAMRFRSFADRCTVVMTLPSHRAVQCVCVSLSMFLPFLLAFVVGCNDTPEVDISVDVFDATAIASAGVYASAAAFTNATH